jgi:hypothetical protein
VIKLKIGEVFDLSSDVIKAWLSINYHQRG